MSLRTRRPARRQERSAGVPPPSAPPPAAASDRLPGGRAVAGAVAGCLVLGCGLSLLPGPATPGPPPPPGRAAREAAAGAAVTAGAPADRAQLAALVRDIARRTRSRPGDAAAWAVLGAARTGQAVAAGRPEGLRSAEQDLRTALKAGRGAGPAALTGLAALAAARNDPSTARSWGERAVSGERRPWQAYAVLVPVYAELGEQKAAEGALKELRARHPGAVARAAAAVLYAGRGRREDSAAAAEDGAALAEHPAEQAALRVLAGQLAADRGEYGEALRWFGAALRAVPGQGEALAGRARALAALGRTAPAETAYRASLTARPDTQTALESGELAESQGRTAAAGQRYAQVRALVRRAAGYGVRGSLVLGRLEADHGDPRAAVRILTAEWRRAPGAAVGDALGWALHRAGQDVRAAAVARKAAATGVRDARLAYHQGESERALGRAGAARRLLADALRIDPYFSPLDAPRAREGLAALGEPGEPTEAGDELGASPSQTEANTPPAPAG
ncbi:hypothetical protein [Streptomyces sp. NPDC058045]|uniref:hypothetical protein n=1 Tax=Streptomyces sp. NPDC058045 TaxID=3346311 RepID=UPI0036EF64B2